ncbi:TPA: hypothetical protein ACPJ1F_004438 [Vibrio diabolicus]
MTKNIEERTEAAVSKYEGAAGKAEQFAETDSNVSTAAGPRKSFPKLSREIEGYALESLRLGVANRQGGYFVGASYDNPNWTYTYNGQQWGLSANFDLSLLPYETTEVDPNNDDNLSVYGNASERYVNQAQGEGVGGSIYPELGVLANGMPVDEGTTHLRVLINGKPTLVAMSPMAYGAVSLLTEVSATIGGTPVKFYDSKVTSFQTVRDMLSADTYIGFTYEVSGTLWEKNSDSNPDVISNYTSKNRVNLKGFDLISDHTGKGVSELPPKTVDITSPMTLSTEGFQGVGTPSLLYADSDMTGDVALSFVRTDGLDLRLSDFRFSAGPNYIGESLMSINYQRLTLTNVRLAVETGSDVSESILHLENTISSSLIGVTTFNGATQSVPGLYLGVNTNAVDVIGGAYNSLGHAVILGPNAGQRISLKTTIESSVASPYEGLLIQGGTNVEIDCYFENSGITIEGGNQIKIGGTFGTSSSAIKITGGESITVDNYRNRGASPRNGFEIDGGDVHFTQNNSISDNATFITAKVKVSGEYCGENLLQNPYFDDWTGGLPDGYDLVPSAGTTVSQEASGLYGLNRLRWDMPVAGNLSLVIRMDSLIVGLGLLGHDVTIGAWVYLPDIASNYYSFSLITNDGVDSPVKEARFAAVRGAYVFVQLTASVDSLATQLRFVIRAPVATGGEYASVDSIKLIKGRTKSGIPFAI